MARRAIRRGKCYNCKKEFGKTAVKRHLMKCNNLGEGNTNYFMLKIEGYYDKDYWIYVQIKEAATLKDLDSFLRDIWLECCGHLSAFEIDHVYYEDNIEDDSFGLFRRDIRDMGKIKLKDILNVGLVFKHEYDFGSATTLKLTVVEKFKGLDTANNITLLARNNMAQYKCTKCGEKATYVGVEYGYGSYSFFCDKCIKDYDDMYIYPITNSPRMGVCGYCGENDIYQLD